MNIQLFNGLKYFITRKELPKNEIDEDIKRSIQLRAHDYFLKDGILFYQPSKQQEPLLVIEETKLRRVLEEGHAGTNGGHFGLEATYLKLKENFYWPRMYKIIEDFVHTCPICQRRGKPKKNNTLTPIKVSEPFELIGIDLIGPLEITSSGNRYIIVMTEYLTKWVEAKAIPDKKASTVAKFLHNDVIARFGTPKRILSDQGSEFLNETIKALQEVMKIQGIYATPYHPQTNGQTERTNKTLCTILTNYQIEKKGEWDEWISTALYAYRSKVHTTTKFTPAFLLYGFQMKTPIVLDLYKDLSDEDKLERTAREHANLIGERLRNVRDLSQQNANKRQERQKRYFDKKVTEKQFKRGEQVLLYDKAQEHKHGDKFRDIYKGPYYIEDVKDNGTYKLRNDEGQIKNKWWNGDLLKKYYARPQWESKVVVDYKPRTVILRKDSSIRRTAIPVPIVSQKSVQQERIERIKQQKMNLLKQDIKNKQNKKSYIPMDSD
jgi:hypothetical protein